MTTLITNKFREHLGSQLIESFTEPANNVYYLLASRHIPFTNDNAPPNPNNSVQELVFDVHEQSIFGKKISATDIKYVVPRSIWTANTVYAAYDHEDGELFNKNFYVAVDAGATYRVYKVLDNNNGAASRVKPTSTLATASSFTTTDGYVYKFMYSMTEAQFEKFLTSDMMPVDVSANVAGNTISGAIDIVKVNSGGSSYVSTFTGTLRPDDIRDSIPVVGSNTTTYRLANSASSNNDFYTGSCLYITSGQGAGQIRTIIDYDGTTRVAVVNTAFTTAPTSTSQYLIAPLITITGDGSDAVGYATVSSNSTVNNFISKINVINRGSNYSYASAIITGNTAGVSNAASLKVIIPPPGGHGKNPVEELGVKHVTISTTFSGSESGFIPVINDYRKFVILRDPLFRDVTFTCNTSTIDGSFGNGETIYQIDYKTLTGSVSVTRNSNTVTGVSTELDSLTAGDRVVIIDNVSNASFTATVAGAANSTQLTLNSKAPFTSTSSKILYATVLAQAVKVGNTEPFLNCTNVEPKFVTNKLIIGEQSGARGIVTAITVGEKVFNNWNTLDNRYRNRYTTYTGGMAPDALMVQNNNAQRTARFHSANSTFVFMTINKGVVPATSTLSNGSAIYTLDTVSYGPDMVKGTGKTLYVENETPITRSNTTAETFKLVIQI